jgi:hypothetical protein
MKNSHAKYYKRKDSKSTTHKAVFVKLNKGDFNIYFTKTGARELSNTNTFTEEEFKTFIDDSDFEEVK